MTSYFYDRQIRRFIQQIIAVFSHFNVEFGREQDGTKALLRVPVMWGDPTRMAATIIKENSENKLNSVPSMSVYVTGLEYRRSDVQNPTFVDKLHIRERRLNEDTGTYSIYQGNALTVERLMPVPYVLRVNLDIWTSNTEQKLQLLEQILPYFNPSLEIQSTDNFVDWTSLSYIELESTNWSSRSVPNGTDDPIDVATLSFSVPIWLSTPAKVKKLGVIQNIIASIYDADGNLSEDVIQNINLLKNRSYVTPLGYNLLLLNGQATLIPANGPIDNSGELPINSNEPIQWGPLINLYGQLVNGISEIRLKKNNPDNLTEVVGTIAQHPSDPSVMLFTVDVDTVPQNSMRPVNAIIDPTRTGPAAGLPAATANQRYLILEDINAGKENDDSFDGADSWKSIDGQDFVAYANDIIEYNGTNWQIAWSSSSADNTEYVTNLRTGIQYKWTGSQWQKSYEGTYDSGQWSIVL